MAWLIVDPYASGGSAPPTDSNWLPWWHIVSGQVVDVDTRKQYAISEELHIEGELNMNGTSQLVINE